MTRYARERRVYFVEEPILHDGPDRIELTRSPEGVHIVVPHLNHGVRDAEAAQASLLRSLFEREDVHRYVLWFYTPMAMPLAEDLRPLATIYDCMDELRAFKNAPPLLVERERQLFSQAALVFTGGWALYERKKNQHHDVHAFPSSVDVPHFAKARAPQEEPEDQISLAHPRLGFYGVIDERMDLELLAAVAAARPEWSFVMLGPVVKIELESLPRAANIHYLGSKTYTELPRYAAGWDVALLPFARNDSTEFISPTKTPEYLAAGLPVVSTSIRDVVRPYQGLGLVHIADTAAEFVAACETALSAPAGPRLALADEFLSELSWDRTWREMSALVAQALEGHSELANRGCQTRHSERDSERAVNGASVDRIAAGE
jgi:glycosyltransferase involved in cell wall biosynthesis